MVLGAQQQSILRGQGFRLQHFVRRPAQQTERFPGQHHAVQMGTDYATVNKICDNASKSVRIDTLERLMKALDCEVQDLFTEE